MKITLVRHGETEENKLGIIQGQTHGTLSKDGINQAKKLAERLINERFDVIFSSDLKRALDTAEEIIKFHKDIPFETRKELKEIDLGRFQGKTKKELGLANDTNITDAILSNEGETTKMLFERARNFLNFLKQNYQNKNILLIGHNGINKAIIGNLLGYSSQNFNEVEKLKNTSVSIFEINGDKIITKLMNCTKHLE
ncbi:MAG: histidine phosphatase family protein [Candidatus Pacearchaeota archaeon]